MIGHKQLARLSRLRRMRRLYGESRTRVRRLPYSAAYAVSAVRLYSFDPCRQTTPPVASEAVPMGARFSSSILRRSPPRCHLSCVFDEWNDGGSATRMPPSSRPMRRRTDASNSMIRSGVAYLVSAYSGCGTSSPVSTCAACHAICHTAPVCDFACFAICRCVG